MTLFRYFLASTSSVLLIAVPDVILHWCGLASKARSRRTAILLVSLSPILVHFMSLLAGARHSSATVGWITYYCLPIFCLLAFPRFAWSALTRFGREVDRARVTDTSSLRRWTDQYLVLWRQVVLASLGAVASVLTLGFVSPVLEQFVEIAPASYYAVALTSFLLTNALYWLWAWPLLLRRTLRLQGLSLHWHAPLRTPIVRETSRVLSCVALMVAVGVVLLELPVLAVVRHVGDDRAIVLINAAALVVGVSTLMFVAVLPQYLLSALSRRCKWATLDRLSEQIGSIPSTSSAPGEFESLQRRLEIFDRLATQKASHFEGVTVLNYIASAVLTLLPQLLQLVISANA